MAEATHDLLGLLKADHDLVQQLLEKLESTRGDDRHSLLHHIDRAFRIHGEAEEELVYPVYQQCLERRGTAVQVEQHRAEHTVAKEILDDLLRLEPDSVAFDGRLRLLRAMVAEHVEAEEREMFPAMQQGCSAHAMEELARDVAQLKQRLMSRFG